MITMETAHNAMRPRAKRTSATTDAARVIRVFIAAICLICIGNSESLLFRVVRADDESDGSDWDNDKKCSLGPSFNNFTFGAYDLGKCRTNLDLMETDTCNQVFLGGRTFSLQISQGVRTASCSQSVVGYFAKFKGYQQQWVYLIDGEPGSNPFERIEYIGIGQTYDQTNPVNTKYPNKQSAVVVKLAFDRYLMMFDDFG